MASVLPFDNMTIAGAGHVVAAADFVRGSGHYVSSGNDVAVTTADGRIHNVRQSKTPSASCELYGDQTDISSPAGLAEAIVLKRDSDTVASFSGIVTAVYNKESRTTRVDIAGDPVTS